MTLRTIRSEITGTVWKISAAEGDVLAEDDVIMVLESMKMEIPGRGARRRQAGQAPDQ
ncbi:acetyl-CoA carboxylase biotin carboxyl carrier protein subunit [Paraburkholderia sp. BL10I2N1]|uniref:acetyl-CoA carboxylase biotin carboxyl carrier protein subunit n=1 Tax=Paraburkholderia sp. BL10I2N1 TaxID=1938796 RepID=UPI0010E6F48A|nr:acetyl-CoA carboxylase biotin carboxyl carrier protein subunit [Paraburkholderia sp. BL10I2N1]TDN58668.1 biotin-dependent enzyme [Paraburkholderia sp. BL10I2N1]